MCFYCKRPLLYLEATVDHVINRKRGGSHSIFNLVLCCEECNNNKSDKTFNQLELDHQQTMELFKIHLMYEAGKETPVLVEGDHFTGRTAVAYILRQLIKLWPNDYAMVSGQVCEINGEFATVSDLHRHLQITQPYAALIGCTDLVAFMKEELKNAGR